MTAQPPAPLPAAPPPPPTMSALPYPRGASNWGIAVTTVIFSPAALVLAWTSKRLTRKAKWVWTGVIAALWALSAALAIFFALSQNVANSDTSVANAIQSKLPADLTSLFRGSSYGDANVTSPTVTCTTTANDQYDCLAEFTLDAPAESVTAQRMRLEITANQDSSGSLVWHYGTPIPEK